MTSLAEAMSRPSKLRLVSFPTMLPQQEQGLGVPAFARGPSVPVSPNQGKDSGDMLRNATTFFNPPINQQNQAPSIEKAKRYRHITCPHKRTDKGYEEHSVLKFDSNDFQQFGVGVFLYFQYLRRMAWCTFGLFLLFVPALVFFVSGGKYVSSTYGLDKTLMGNMGLAGAGDILRQNRSVIGVLLSSIDLFACVILLLFVLRLSHLQSVAEREYNLRVVTVTHYTVQVSNVPPGLQDRHVYKRFFRKYGPVVDVAITFNDGEMVQAYMERGRIRKEMQASKVANRLEDLEEWKQKLHSVDERITDLELRFQKQAACAFVTFEFAHSVDDVLKAYPGDWWSRLWMGRAKRFEGHRIRVKTAPEPSNILFLNLKYTARQRFMRRAFTFFISLLVICGSASMVYKAQEAQSKVPQVSTVCFTPISISQASAPNAPERAVDCFCSQLGLADAWSKERTLCSDWLRRYILGQMLILAASFAIVINNYVLQRIVEFLVTLEKHTSVTSEQMAVTKKLFIGQFINTSIVLLVLNYKSSVNLGFLTKFGIGNGVYSNLNPDWFSNVGVALVLCMLLNMFTPHSISLIKYFIGRCTRYCRARRCVTQSQLNEVYSGKEFLLSRRYSAALNTFFVTMLYSSGMPILLIIAAVTFTLAYWFDKYTFFRHYRLPERFDASLANYTAVLMPYAVMLHLLMALWFYDCPSFTSFIVSGSAAVDSTDNSVINIPILLSKWNTFPILVFLVVMLFWRVGSWAIWLLIVDNPILKEIFCCCCCNRRRTHAVNIPSYYEAKNKVRMETYHLSDQHAYTDAFIPTESYQQLAPDKALYLEPPTPRSQNEACRSNTFLAGVGKTEAETLPKSNLAWTSVPEESPAHIVPLDIDPPAYDMACGSAPQPQAMAELPMPMPMRMHMAPMAMAVPPLPITHMHTMTQQPEMSLQVQLQAAHASQMLAPPQHVEHPFFVPEIVTDAQSVPVPKLHPMDVNPNGHLDNLMHEPRQPPINASANVQAAEVAALEAAQFFGAYQLLLIACPQCTNRFHIVDTGAEAIYACPFCNFDCYV